MKPSFKLVLLFTTIAMAPGCATLGQLRSFVQPPRFEQANDRPAEFRLRSPSSTRPLGSASVRVWTSVHNPNPFGLTITTLDTTLLVEGRRAASGDFPLGLPLGAQQESVIPIDLEIDFADLPGLASVLRRPPSGDGVAYQLDGTVGIDAGPLGQPTFGPMTLVRGELNPPGARPNR